MADASTRLFKIIREPCVSLANLVLSESTESGSKELINALKTLDTVLTKAICEELNTAVINIDDCGCSSLINPKLADYIMFPITELLKKPSLTDSELEYCLSIMRILVVHCWSSSLGFDSSLFGQLLPLVTFLIGGKPNEFDVSRSSDETLANGIDVIKGLLIGCQHHANIDSFLKKSSMLPNIGHLISVLLNISFQSQIAAIKVSSLQALNLLYHTINDGDLLSVMFPGNVSTFARIAKVRPHSKVLAQMFTTLTTLVNLIFNDLELGITQEELFSLEDLKDLQINSEVGEDADEREEFNVKIPLHKQNQHRTSSWLKATVVQFRKGLEIILKMDDTRLQKNEVKDSLFQFNIKMIRNCFNSCSLLFPLNIGSLSQLCQVDQTYVEQITDSLIYCSYGDLIQQRSLHLLQEELQNISYTFTSPNSDTTITELSYLNLLLKIIINVGPEPHAYAFKLLVEKLHSCITFLVRTKNTKDYKLQFKKIKENISIENQMLLVSKDYIKGKIEVDNIEPKFLFSGVFTKEIQYGIQKLFSTLSESKDALDIADQVLSQDQDLIASAVNTWIASSISNSIENDAIHKIQVDEFFHFSNDSDNDNDQVNEQGDTKMLALKEINYEILDKSVEILNNKDEVKFPSIVSLQSIRSSVEYLQREFEEELINVLYPVIECLASNDEDIRNESQLTAIKIADTLYEGSVREMLQDNMDYLIDSLSNKMVSESLTPKLPIILNVLIRIGSIDILSELEDIIITLFTLLDLYYGYTSLIEGIFLIFDEIIEQIYKKLNNFDWGSFESECLTDDINFSFMWGLQSMDDVKDFVERKAVVPDDLLEAEDISSDDFAEPIKKEKILEIDSDDENEGEEIQSIVPSEMDERESDEESWKSPIQPKVYSILVQILEYGQRIMQVKSTNIVITIMRLIKKIIPLLATQKNDFMPLAVKLWDLLIFNLNNYGDLKVLKLTIETFMQIIRFLNTFLASRVIELLHLLKENKLIWGLIEKNSKLKLDNNSKVLINKSSTSVNWEQDFYQTVCQMLVLSINKMGRFIPNDVGISIIEITLNYSANPSDYGYFDNHVKFLVEYNKNL